MKMKLLFHIMVILLTVTLVATVYAGACINRYMYAVAAVILLVTILFVRLYGKIAKLTGCIDNGMALLNEQDFSSRLAPVGQKDADAIVQLFNRMTDQLKNERLRLREQNHFLDLLISASPMGVIIMDFDGRITMTNHAALAFLGMSEKETKGKLMSELHTPLADMMANIRMDKSETVRIGDSKIYRCSHLSFTDRGFAHPFMLIESITEEIVKAEKKAYGKVIRMIAHEVNNTVTGVISTMDSVGSILKENEGTQDLQEVIQVCNDRCYSMSRFITRFADVVKIPAPVTVPVELNGYVQDSIRFMTGACQDRDITFHTDLCDSPVPVMIDKILFGQVLVNIIKNSAESIGTKGNIYIRTGKSPFMLEIADDGPGITREVEEKLFSPFFSTKPQGQGIGLVCIREILTRHGCTFSLRTYPDGLTRFRIEFPETK